MRGADQPQTAMFNYLSVEDRIPADHPLRMISALINPILTALSPRFDALYARRGRPSIPPERLLRAWLLQILYTIRSERPLMEQLNYNLLFRWFVGLNPDDAMWVPTVFSKNRERLVEGAIAEAFMQEVLKAANARGLLSHDHFTVDGTLLEAWASQKSVPREDDPPPPSDGDPKNPTINFHGERRSNATHQSVTDPAARLARKSNGTASILAHLGSVVMDNRHGLIVATDARAPGYTAECDAAVEMLTHLEPRTRRRTLGADNGYDRPELVRGALRAASRPMSRRTSMPGNRECHRWAHDAARGVRHQSSETQASRGRLRLGQDHRGPAQTQASRAPEGRLDLHLHQRRVQPGADANADPRGSLRVNCQARPRHRPEGLENGPARH